jgi:deoxyribose-phosphate aldolase
VVIKLTPERAEQILSLIDLTSLNETDDAATIAALCDKACQVLHGKVAAVCIYPRFVRQASDLLRGTLIKIATVVNFPDANEPLPSVISAIEQALQEGANEIDVVFPYPHFLAGEKAFAEDFIKQCKKTCGKNNVLKVILEIGALPDEKKIAEASQIALSGGADFLKTSTGKIAQGATLEAAAVMLQVIKERSLLVKQPFGLKVSGGIRTPVQAIQYIELAEQIMGETWVMPAHFRIGASQLADAIENFHWPF